MSEREALIRIFKKALRKYYTAESIVDFLLSRGVTVPQEAISAEENRDKWERGEENE